MGVAVVIFFYLIHELSYAMGVFLPRHPFSNSTIGSATQEEFTDHQR